MVLWRRAATIARRRIVQRNAPQHVPSVFWVSAKPLYVFAVLHSAMMIGARTLRCARTPPLLVIGSQMLADTNSIMGCYQYYCWAC